MLRLGYGRNRRLACAALTELTSAVGVDIAADKMLAKQLLADAGIPVAEGVLAASAEEAARALGVLGPPVVIKPLRGNQGRCVTVGVRTPHEAITAFDRAGGGSPVLVERFVTGHDYRVLVIDGRVAAAAQLHPACVTGDAAHTISQLVAQVNADPRRGDGHARELTRISLDDEVMRHLDAAGLDGGSVPAAGQVVALRQNANLSTGGTSRDVTDLVHEDVAALCVRAAAAAGLDICGVDLRAPDIAAPLDTGRPGGGTAVAVLELNACPGLRMHLAPVEGRPRDVAAAIVDTLYPPGTQARIPVIAVTGTNGKTTTVRMIGHVLSQAGLRVGMATTDGVYSGGRLVYDADASGPRSAEMVLDDTERGGRGAGDRARRDPARRAGLRPGRRGRGHQHHRRPPGRRRHRRHDRADPRQGAGSRGDPGRRDGGAQRRRPGRRRARRPAGGAPERPGDQVLQPAARQPGAGAAQAGRRPGLRGPRRPAGGDRGRPARPLIPVAELPGAFGGRAAHLVANALAAAAACRAAGFSAKDIRRGLATFTPVEANPGRGNVYRAGDVPVIVDYGHNAAALDATGAMITNVWGGEPAAAVTLPGDRRDDLVTETAEAIAAWFGKVVVYEDSDKRGRRPGEMQELIAAAMRRVRPDIACEPAAGPEQALRRAVALADGGPVLFLYEKLTAARAAVESIGGIPVARRWPGWRPALAMWIPLPTPGCG